MEQNYLVFGKKNNPGKYRKELSNLPDSVEEIFKIIKSTLIHPNDIGKYRNELPIGISSEDHKFDSVYEMITEIINRDNSGLTKRRVSENRLILSCRYHALLMVAILKSKGIEARVRAGFASYLGKGNKYCDHWICQYKKKDTWIISDPEKMVNNVPVNDFHFPGDIWLKVKNHELNPGRYGLGRVWGHTYIMKQLFHDICCLANIEHTYFDYPEIVNKNIRRLTIEELDYFDFLASECLRIEATNNLVEYKNIYNKMKKNLYNKGITE